MQSSSEIALTQCLADRSEQIHAVSIVRHKLGEENVVFVLLFRAVKHNKISVVCSD